MWDSSVWISTTCPPLSPSLFGSCSVELFNYPVRRVRPQTGNVLIGSPQISRGVCVQSQLHRAFPVCPCVESAALSTHLWPPFPLRCVNAAFNQFYYPHRALQLVPSIPLQPAHASLGFTPNSEDCPGLVDPQRDPCWPRSTCLVPHPISAAEGMWTRAWAGL